MADVIDALSFEARPEGRRYINYRDLSVQRLGSIKVGVVKPPFRWDKERRLRLRAKLDAIFFYLYGVTDRDDVRYVYSTFPIVERQETAEYGRLRSRDLCLANLNALSAGLTLNLIHDGPESLHANVADCREHRIAGSGTSIAGIAEVLYMECR